MEMIDMGVSASRYNGVSPSKPDKNKKYYPSFSIEKDIGNFKIGQTVALHTKAMVTSLHKDDRGTRITFEVRSLGVGKNLSKDQVGMKLAGDILSKKD